VPERAFPVIYAADVERSAGFWKKLGFEEQFRLPPEGEPGYVGLRRGNWELAVTTEQSPRELIGVEVGSGPRFEMFVYVGDVDGEVERLRAEGVSVLREPEDMFWGERIAWVVDPDGNPVALAARDRPAWP
jgi:lactoylglutathione lyase